MVCWSLSAAVLSVQGCVTKDMTASKSYIWMIPFLIFEEVPLYFTFLFIAYFKVDPMSDHTFAPVYSQAEKDLSHSILRLLGEM